MKGSRHGDTAFRVAFIVLLTAAVALWLWESLQGPPGPSRVGWPTRSATYHP